MPPIVELPPELPDGGYVFSPIFTVTALSGTPNVSAATIVSAVRVPVPRSFVPMRSSIVPSLFTMHMHCDAWPAPPQVASDRPSPRFTGPADVPRGRHFFFQPIMSAPIISSSR